VISEELATFVQSGVSILVGTRDAACRPEGTRGFGALVGPARDELTVFVAASTGGRTLANARANGRVAVCFTRIVDHRSMQLKGSALEVRDARPEERVAIDRYGGLLVQIMGEIGVPPRIILRLSRWPAHALRLRIESVFVQTPGPGAGAPLGGSR
jgi:hypothetical protein